LRLNRKHVKRPPIPGSASTPTRRHGFQCVKPISWSREDPPARLPLVASHLAGLSAGLREKTAQSKAGTEGTWWREGQQSGEHPKAREGYTSPRTHGSRFASRLLPRW